MLMLDQVDSSSIRQALPMLPIRLFSRDSRFAIDFIGCTFFSWLYPLRGASFCEMCFMGLIFLLRLTDLLAYSWRLLNVRKVPLVTSMSPLVVGRE